MPSSGNTCRESTVNINTFQNKEDPNRNVPLQNISINETLELLDQQVSIYRKDVKNQSYLFYGSKYDSETRTQIISDIQKELEVYHYYKEVTLRLLCEMFCMKERQNLYIMSIFDSLPADRRNFSKKRKMTSNLRISKIIILILIL